MTVFIRIYLVSLSIFLAFDAAWLTFMVPSFYGPLMENLMRGETIWTAAILFYLMYPAAIAALAVMPALANRQATSGFWRGAVLGTAAYGTYNLTNYATLDGWPLIVTIVDQIWGMILGGTVAACSTTVLLNWQKRQPVKSGNSLSAGYGVRL